MTWVFGEHLLDQRRQSGGLWFYNSHTEIINCVVVENFAPFDGGALYCDAGSRPLIKNSILTANWPEQIFVNSGERSDVGAYGGPDAIGWLFND